MNGSKMYSGDRNTGQVNFLNGKIELSYGKVLF